jgi:hypothetical protein
MISVTDTCTVTHTHEFLGDHGEGETPVPIPNTAVKPFSADGTAWVTVWESRTLPRLKLCSARAGQEEPARNGRFFFDS